MRRPTRVSFPWLASNGIEYDLTCDVHPGYPGCRTLPNGDPGWPPDGPEVEVVHVKTFDGALGGIPPWLNEEWGLIERKAIEKAAEVEVTS